MKISGFYLESTTNNRVRLDIDGNYPQNAVSGVVYFKNQNGGTDLLYWFIRKCKWDYAGNKGEGDINYLFWNDKTISNTSWYRKINFELNQSTKELKVTFSGGGHQALTATYKFNSEQFQDVKLEFDYQKGFTPTLTVKPKAIFKPAEIPTDAEFKALPDVLTIEEVFKRTGYLAHRTGKDNEITINAPAGTNPLDYEWGNAELHDVMQYQWSLYNQDPGMMALWTFITSRLKNLPNVAGRMFDTNNSNINGDTNKKPRQGCAIFYRQSIFNDNPVEWNEAAKFITTVHEIGHCFNLFHSFEKKMTNNGAGKPFNPWIPEEMVDTSATRSFMNYHSEYTGGGNYFKDFRYRFSDQEIFFMRHAPKWFIKMGEYDWGFNHASVEDYELTVKIDKPKNSYNFLEPVVVELQLKNISKEVKKIDRGILQNNHHTRLFLQKDEGEIKMLRPFNHDCIIPEYVSLKPGEIFNETFFVSADVTGWKITDPGKYTVRAVVEVDEKELISNVLDIRILHPSNREEDIAAQDYFTDGVARILNYDGSKYLTKENDVLKQIAERFATTNPEAALHAKIALLLPDTQYFNAVNTGKQGPLSFILHSPKIDAIEQLNVVLKNADLAVQTLTRMDYLNYNGIAKAQLKNHIDVS